MVWPIIALGAATIGGLGWLIFGGNDKKTIPLTTTKEPSTPLAPATPKGNIIKPVEIMPMVVNPVTGQPVPKGTPQFVKTVQAEGPARTPAYTLHDYIKSNGYKGPQFKGLVAAFQQATNNDPMAVALHGPIPTDGIYNAQTSGALSMYTGDVIPADPNAPLPPKPKFADIVDITKPGAAAISAFQLQVFFKKNKHDKNNPLERNLVRQFQHDVNTDPKAPGPALAIPGLPKLIGRLAEDGDFGSSTRKALDVFGGVAGQG
jgi:peptidoglycan hydrolase-like protein with peptidoglycan-binding domain